MGEFTNKIDFEVLVMVQNANPNGDPLNGNRPRETYDGFGEISNEDMQKVQKDKDRDEYAKAACKEWIDVRSFGQVFAFKDGSVSVGVRGPVSVHSAFSVLPVSIDSMQITQSEFRTVHCEGKY